MKKLHGIKYKKGIVSECGKYQFWESETHPSYNHWTKIKSK